LLIALLAFAPLAFGVVQAWSEEIVVVLAALLAVCFCVQKVVTRHTAVAGTWAVVPVAAILLLAVVQAIPLPVRVVGMISPNTVAQKAQLLADLQGRPSLPSWMPLSFYPYATVHDLRLVLAAAAVFVVVLRVFRRPDQITRLLLAVAVIGAGVALVALTQDILGNGKIYWSAASPRGAFSGPFVNQGHYAQFMNLSMGAALAVVLVKAHEVFRGGRTTPAAVAGYLSSSQGGLIWGLSAMIVLGAATIFLSLSCGGMISLTVAAVFTTLVLSFTRSLRGSSWLIAMMALGALVGVLYCGYDCVYERLGALRGLNRAAAGRWQIIEDAAVAWTRFPVTGTGLGTHEVVYPMFDRSASAALATHVENEYAQAAEEMGLLGLAALLTLAVFVWRSYAQAVRTTGVPICSAAYGLGFGLSAVLVHSLSDFGQRLPANAVLSAVFCALMIRLPYLGHGGGTATPELLAGAKRGRPWDWLALAAVCLVSGWAIGSADAARRGEIYWGRALARERSLTAAQWQGKDDEYRDLLQNAGAACQCQPANIHYCYWLNVYRWRALSRVTDPSTGQIVRAEPVRWVERVAGELKQALRRCPTFGPAWCVLGQLERALLGQEEPGARHIRQGVKLAPCDPTARLVAGMLEAEQGRTDVALEHLRKAVQLDEHLFPEMASQLMGVPGGPDLAWRVAGSNRARLRVITDLQDFADGPECTGEVPDWIETPPAVDPCAAGLCGQDP
jgi:hypothetical protein